MRAKEFLSNFILEAPEEVRARIIQKVDAIDNEEDLKNILQYSNQYTFKQDVGTLSVVKGYKDVVSNIILQVVGKLDEPPEKIKEFLNKLSTDGIVKETDLLTTGRLRDMNQIIDPNYLDIFNKIKLELFEKISGKIGEKGDVGKGEYLLSILSPQIVRRGAPGDLNIMGKNVELKAGTSGRLGPSGSQALAGRFDEYITALKEMKLLPEEVDYSENILDFNLALNMSKFSETFENDNVKVKKALGLLLKMHYPSENTSSIVSSIVSNGQIDGRELKKQMLSTSFKVYQAAKSFDGVLLSDYGMNKYLYINTPENAAEIVDFVSVKFPRWEDTQSNTVKLQIMARSKPEGAVATSSKKTKASSTVSKPDATQPDATQPDAIQPGAASIDKSPDNLERMQQLAGVNPATTIAPGKNVTSLKGTEFSNQEPTQFDTPGIRNKRKIFNKERIGPDPK